MEVVRLAMDLKEKTICRKLARDESKAKHKAKRNESIKGCME